MMITILAPEFTLSLAVNSLVAAHGWKFWSAKGSHARPVRNQLANMGYFVLDWGPRRDGVDYAPDAEHCTEDGSIKSSQFERLLQEMDKLSGSPDFQINRNAQRLRRRYWTLSQRQWSLVRDWDIAQLPDTPDHHLERLSAPAGLIKLIAMIQILWLLVQVIIRKADGKPSSQLEVATLAFAAESALTYLCYWTKPQDIESYHITEVNPCKEGRFLSASVEEVASLAEKLVDLGPDPGIPILFHKSTMISPDQIQCLMTRVMEARR